MLGGPGDGGGVGRGLRGESITSQKTKRNAGIKDSVQLGVEVSSSAITFQ